MLGASQDRLEDISTEWAIVCDPAEFVIRYQVAIRKYLGALIRNPDDAEEVLQDFFLRVSQNGFVRARQERGRFRDYLKAAIRNAAITFHRRHHQRKAPDSSVLLEAVRDPRQPNPDRIWLRQWRQVLLKRALRALLKHQERSPENLSYSILKLIVNHPHEDAKRLAQRTSAILGRLVRPDAFRQKVSRARRLLARALVEEIAQTLDHPKPHEIEEELRELELWPYVAGYVASKRRRPTPKSPPAFPPKE